MTNLGIRMLPVLDPPWTRMEPVRLGAVPSGLGTAHRFVTVEADGRPLLCADLYGRDEAFISESACSWSRFVVIGWGHHVYLVDPQTRAHMTLDLGYYFMRLYPLHDRMLIASAQRLFCLGADGVVRWRSAELGEDGVEVTHIDNRTIRGRGDWDPPGGYRPFQISLHTGQRM